MWPIVTDVVWSVCLSAEAEPKWLNWSRCHLGCGLGFYQGTVHWVGGLRSPHGNGKFWKAYRSLQRISGMQSISQHYLVGGSSDAAFCCHYCSGLLVWLVCLRCRFRRLTSWPMLHGRRRHCQLSALSAVSHSCTRCWVGLVSTRGSGFNVASHLPTVSCWLPADFVALTVCLFQRVMAVRNGGCIVKNSSRHFANLQVNLAMSDSQWPLWLCFSRVPV